MLQGISNSFSCDVLTSLHIIAQESNPNQAEMCRKTSFPAVKGRFHLNIAEKP